MTRQLIGISLASLLVAAISAPAASPSPAPKATSAPVSKPASAPAVVLTPTQEAIAKVTAAYMKNDLGPFTEAHKAALKIADLTPAQRQDLLYMRNAMNDFHPAWWPNCRSSVNVSFQATIWGKGFSANYMPLDTLGFQAPVDIKNGKIVVVVAWKPSMVDSPKPGEGFFCERFGVTKGDIAEAIVWHELGHNYVTNFLPLDVVIKLYNDHMQIFETVQEFYGDMSALYHSSPKARLTTMAMRISGIDENREEEAHNRASQGIGSLILANWLMDPNKWPNVHFPAAVPDTDAERKTLMYCYGQLDSNWSFSEDRALRELIKKYIETKGDSVLRSKGEIQLPNKLSFKMIATDDRELQKKRDKWVADQLKLIIDSGRADKNKAPEKKGEWRGRPAVIMPW